MQTYTIIAGVNGVGKSSLTGVLRAERSDLGYVVDVDKLAIEKHCSAIEAGKLALTKINDYLDKSLSFSQETTLSGIRITKTVRLAKDKGYRVRLFYIGLNSYEESVKRIQNRVAKGGHNIEERDVDRRYRKRFDDLIKVLPYCDEVHFFDNENGFVEVAEYKNGALIPKGDNKPSWLHELQALL